VRICTIHQNQAHERRKLTHSSNTCILFSHRLELVEVNDTVTIPANMTHIIQSPSQAIDWKWVVTRLDMLRQRRGWEHSRKRKRINEVATTLNASVLIKALKGILKVPWKYGLGCVNKGGHRSKLVRILHMGTHASVMMTQESSQAIICEQEFQLSQENIPSRRFDRSRTYRIRL
jgi:hypothetical protein